MTALSLVAAIGATLVGAIGFAMSYSTLAAVARQWGFSTGLAPWFPIGVDASIVAFLALDLYLIRKGTPWPLLRMAAHGMTAATIWFNASSQGHGPGADPVRAAAHGIMPVLFVIGVEAARRLIIRKAKLEAGTVADRIPLHRWILAPIATPRVYRRMRLHGITSYPEMIRRERDLMGYEQWLTRKHGGSLRKASEDEKLPMTMAAHGYTVAEALDLPDRQNQAAQERAEEAEQRRLDTATRQKVARAQAEARQTEADGELDAVRARVEGETGQARARSRAQVSAAERIADAEKEALESAVLAEARAREAEADRREAEHRETQATADERAAETEYRAAEKRRAAAEADRLAAAETQAVETKEIAEARKHAAEADHAAAETERAATETRRAAAETRRREGEEDERREAALADIERSKLTAAETERAAAETRRAAAEIEARAVEMEDIAKLSPRERAVRKVARMILTAGRSATDVALADIQRETGVSPATASDYRQQAIDLIDTGYNPAKCEETP